MPPSLLHCAYPFASYAGEAGSGGPPPPPPSGMLSAEYPSGARVNPRIVSPFQSYMVVEKKDYGNRSQGFGFEIIGIKDPHMLFWRGIYMDPLCRSGSLKEIFIGILHRSSTNRLQRIHWNQISLPAIWQGTDWFSRHRNIPFIRLSCIGRLGNSCTQISHDDIICAWYLLKCIGFISSWSYSGKKYHSAKAGKELDIAGTLPVPEYFMLWNDTFNTTDY